MRSKRRFRFGYSDAQGELIVLSALGRSFLEGSASSWMTRALELSDSRGDADPSPPLVAARRGRLSREITGEVSDPALAEKKTLWAEVSCWDLRPTFFCFRLPGRRLDA